MNDEFMFLSFDTLPVEEIEKGLTVKTLSAGTSQIRHLVFEPGTLIPDHRHPGEVVTMVFEGSMEMTVGDETRNVTAGDVFRVPPKTGHSAERVVAVSWSPVK